MKPYSQDLRERIMRAVDRGMPKAEAARTFEVALSTVKQDAARRERTGSLVAGRGSGRPCSLPPTYPPALEAQLRAHPNDTVAEHAARWEAEQHAAVGVDALRRAMRRV